MSDSVICAFCNSELDFMTIQERENHYEAHFSEQAIEHAEASRSATDNNASSSLQTATQSSTWKTRKWPFPKETDVFWHPQMTEAPPKSCTPGLIPFLKSMLEKSHSRGKTRRATLCVDNAVLFSREPWDAGWGCGYRNFLMACAALMTQGQQPSYRFLLEAPFPPTIRNLQRWIEDAWSAGFDPDGKKQLQKLVNTRKWIGTADLWVAFTYRRIPHETDVLIDWIVDYFTPKGANKQTDAFQSLQSSCVNMTDKMPIILQHNGHSRTIVGYEVTNTGSINLLTFDPAYKPPDGLRKEVLSRSSNGSTQSQSLSHRQDASLKLVVASSSVNVDSALLHTLGHNTGQKRKRSDENSPQKAGPSKRRVDIWRPDETSFLKAFRLQPFKVGKKNEYQILYFPMTLPLSEAQRLESKEVRSTKVT
ncbi:hypothetical protein CVT24_009385 [Panaeolus cyanescens]|uniref:UFSP1/2/DUB catalytic domain-containing protein n=1 Tax=Panaeolus cyanescens TaxID=181874 RepID=A0A409VAS4_9AGAR|nr:hypothetical protein CVT24_009385 [Panaeolus cyanescens]